MEKAARMSSPALRIVPYEPSLRPQWDEFVRASKNGTFLHERGYCEYHQDRFDDASLMVFDAGHLVALLPATQRDGVVTSHGGLTYGGLITDRSMTLPAALGVFDSVLCFLKEHAFRQLVYRAIPVPYHRLPSGEDLVAMFLLSARLARRSAVAMVDQGNQGPRQTRRRRGARQAAAAGVVVGVSDDVSAYWELLSEVLRTTHDSSPVHSASEMSTLMQAFPDNIHLHGAWLGADLVAGVVVYETDRVARAQYIAAGEDGKRHHALDLLFQSLLDETYATKRFFDFGTSERDGPELLKRGLVEQKEGFGARTVVQDDYEVDVSSYVSGYLRQTFDAAPTF
jgi:hypothetical protein